MESIRGAIQRVQSIYSKGIQSKDTRLSNRHAYSMLLTGRGTILKQQANKGQKINEWTMQVLPCVELIEAPIHECPCVPTNGITILKTKYKLPSPISGLDRSLITSVSNLDGREKLDPTTYEEVKYLGGNKFTPTKPRYYIRNQFGYIVNRGKLRGVTINGLFGDPLSVYRFPSLCCTDCNCTDLLDYEFPADEDTLKGILQLVNNELILFTQMSEDKSNNSSDDTGQPRGKMIHQPEAQ